MTAPSDAPLSPSDRHSNSALPPFLLLYAALYSAYGTESAFLPAFFQRGHSVGCHVNNASCERSTNMPGGLGQSSAL